MKKAVVSLMMVALLVAAAGSAEAKGPQNAKANGKAAVALELKAEKNLKVKENVLVEVQASGTAPCMKPAWGLFKKNPRPLPPGCVVPPGILKKIGGPAPTSTPTSTPPDVIAPVISSVSSTPATSTLTLRWNTNENATGKIYFGTVNPLNLASSSMVLVNTMSTTQAVTLSGLAPNTTYYFVIETRDAAGNVSTSSQMSATTLNWDVTPPTITSVNVTGIASTSASIGWTTNEAATGKLTYATSSALTGASTVTNSVLAGAQAVNISGLQASTTYYFAIEAKDANGNTSTSSVQSFITLP